MYRLKTIVAIFLFLHLQQTKGSDVDCSTQESFVSLGQRSFTMAVGGRSYSCDCRGNECEQMTCVVIEVNVSPINNVRDTCRDLYTGRYYARGATFLRHTTAGINLACKCPELGPLEVECKKPQCTIPPPITNFDAPPKVNGSCYDRYTNRWHAHGIAYTRRVIMSYSPDILGFYSCTCNAIGTKCKALDIPCCDSETGKFAAKSHRFTAAIGSSKQMDCMCLGGRGKIGDCREPEKPTPEITPRRRQCYDRLTRKIYDENERFVKYLQDGDRNCTCRRRRSRMLIRCSRRRSS